MLLLCGEESSGSAPQNGFTVLSLSAALVRLWLSLCVFLYAWFLVVSLAVCLCLAANLHIVRSRLVCALVAASLAVCCVVSLLSRCVCRVFLGVCGGLLSYGSLVSLRPVLGQRLRESALLLSHTQKNTANHN